MSKHKEMYSKAYIQSQLDEMAEKVGLQGFKLVGPNGYVTKSEYQGYISAAKESINAMKTNAQKMKHKTTSEVVHISKKQWCAALQGTASLVFSALEKEDLNSEETTQTLLFVTICTDLAKQIWKNKEYSKDEPIEILFQEPDSDE